MRHEVAVWWLRKLEPAAIPPRRLAPGWGLSMVLLGVATEFAVFYSGVELRLMDWKNAVLSFLVIVLLSVPMYYYAVLSARSAKMLGGPPT